MPRKFGTEGRFNHFIGGISLMMAYFIFQITAPQGAISVANGVEEENVLLIFRPLISSFAIRFPSLMPIMSKAS